MRLRDRSERLSIGDKIALTIVIVIALLILLAFFGFITGRWSDEADAAPAPPPVTGEKLRHTCITDDSTRERLRAIMFEALDEALHDQWKKLFVTWMADERGQPDRAQVGVSQALRAHQIARQLAEKWMPPLCQ